MKSIDVIIDTDIGDDVDDSFALAQAVLSPELNVLGITTATGDTQKRAGLVKAILRDCGRTEVPVVAGTPQEGAPPKLAHAFPAPGDVGAPEGSARFLVETLKEHPGALILELAPMTNLAEAFALDPETMGQSKIIAMGGIFGTVFPEWNIVSDPEAARAVADAAGDLTLIGLEQTLKLGLTAEEIKTIHESNVPVGRRLARYISAWKELTGFSPYLHDVAVVAFALAPRLFTTRAAEICVETGGNDTRGVTFLRENPFQPEKTGSDRHRIVTGYDAQAVKELFFKTVL